MTLHRLRKIHVFALTLIIAYTLPLCQPQFVSIDLTTFFKPLFPGRQPPPVPQPPQPANKPSLEIPLKQSVQVIPGLKRPPGSQPTSPRATPKPSPTPSPTPTPVPEPQATAPAAAAAAPQLLPEPSVTPAPVEDLPTDAEGWRVGRATFYAGPKYFTDAYAYKRGKDAFGMLAHGSCGYTNEPSETIPFPQDSVAALADHDPDYPGSCGRCYEVRCKEGPVLGQNGVTFSKYWVDYLADMSKPKDTFGREFPGNPLEEQELMGVKCWNPRQSVVVRIVDTCPCFYKPYPDKMFFQEVCCFNNATGVPKPQLAGQYHFDLSYWAFEKLAHPTYGLMMTEFRPVDCDSHTPLPRLVPGYISRTIYSDKIEPGWTWRKYESHAAEYWKKGAGLDGSNATCVSLSPKGGFGFACKECTKPGYQPFVNTTKVTFWIRSDSKSSNEYETSTPRGVPPNMKLFIYNEDTKLYCHQEVHLNATQPVLAKGEWYNYQIPLSRFECINEVSPDKINRIDMQNTNERDAAVCIDELKLE